MNSEAEKVTKPIQSTRWAAGSRESEIRVKVTRTAPMPMGRFTKKIHCQPIPLVIAPPTSGPTAMAPPRTAP